MKNSEQSTVLAVAMFFVGGALGVLLVRGFFLDPVEQMGWWMFWSGISHGEPMRIDAVLESTTFAKCACGFVVAGLGAALLTRLVATRRFQPNPPPAGEEKTVKAYSPTTPSIGCVTAPGASPELRDERECPYCAEVILKKARVCKHCGRDVEPLLKADAPAQATSAVPPKANQETRRPEPPAPRPAATTSRPLVMATGPQFRSISEPPGKMKYVLLGGTALIMAFAGGWYYQKSKSKQEVQQAQQAQNAQPAPRTSTSSATSTEITPAAVPFVGCENHARNSLGDGITPAPSATDKVVKIHSRAAETLSYYKAAFGPGVLAPRGWNCFSSSGSAGSTLTVTPQAQEPTSRTAGPMVVLSTRCGGTSGRFTVAQVIARVFPAHEAFARKVMNEGLLRASDYPFGPYPTDKLMAQGDSTVEYQTPPESSGLGTDAGMAMDDNPIEGVAILKKGELSYSNPSQGIDVSQDADWFDLLLLGVRLPPEMYGLASEIIQQVELENSSSQSPGTSLTEVQRHQPAQSYDPTPAELDAACQAIRNSGVRCDDPNDPSVIQIAGMAHKYAHLFNR